MSEANIERDGRRPSYFRIASKARTITNSNQTLTLCDCLYVINVVSKRKTATTGILCTFIGKKKSGVSTFVRVAVVIS